MINVEFVRAGAGSGKTYYLTRALAEALSDGLARCEAVVATTFTIRAASELRQRARGWLLQQGRLDLVTGIGQSRIGTVNSVCAQLIKRFCFELGMSPEQTVLTDSQARALIGTSLDLVMDAEGRERLSSLGRRLCQDGDAITGFIKKVLDAARQNGIPAADLAAMGAMNANSMLANWPAPVAGPDYTDDLLVEVNAAEAAVRASVETARAAGARVTKVAESGLADLQRIRRDLASGGATWAQWEKLRTLNAGAPQRAALQAMQQRAAAHAIHPAFHADIRNYLEAVFSLAALALEGFERAKQEMGAVDFTDQEVLLLRALQQSELVRRALSSELDLVLVDEFQDTSPLQLAIFVELAKLARRSIWVGDPKQAIYGFRGTDSDLIQQVLSSVENWGGCIGAPLSTSYRSTPELVSLANQLFVPAFAPTPPEQVRLEADRATLGQQPALMNWSFQTTPRKRAEDFSGMGQAIRELLQGKTMVQDRTSQEMRPVQPDDVSVLCRTNKEISEIVRVLAAWGIPVAASRPGLLTTPEARLVVACLRRLHDPADTVASAMILGLADCAEPETWLGDRLDFLASDGKPRDWKLTGDSPHPLLLRLHALRPRLLSLTPSESLRLAKAESGVATLVHKWSGEPRAAEVRTANIEALLAMGARYEEECVSSKRPATVDGLLQWLSDQAAADQDSRAAAAHGAVEVMTFHGAKGLEWPVVIIAGMNRGHRSDLWGVRARTDGAFDANSPLANRFVHYWVYPFGDLGAPQVAVDAEESETGRAMQAEALRENTRLLYVSFTRARDLLILAGSTKEADRPPGMAWLDEVGAGQTLWGPSESITLEDGRNCNRQSQFWSLGECTAVPAKPAPGSLRYFQTGSPVECEPLWVQPSASAPGDHRVVEVQTVGSRIAVTGRADMALIGTALHHCIAFALADASKPLRQEQVFSVLDRWGVVATLDAGAVLHQMAALIDWLQAKWPQGKVQAEVPIQARRNDGRIVNGQIDLLVKTEHGWIVIDHKADPRWVGTDDRLALAHGAQLAEYARAVELATGEKVSETWLFLPTVGKAVRISSAAA